MPSAPKNSPDKEIIKTFEAAGVVDYMEYLKSGKRVFWVNFKAGVAKGLGLTDWHDGGLGYYRLDTDDVDQPPHRRGVFCGSERPYNRVRGQHQLPG